MESPPGRARLRSQRLSLPAAHASLESNAAKGFSRNNLQTAGVQSGFKRSAKSGVESLEVAGDV